MTDPVADNRVKLFERVVRKEFSYLEDEYDFSIARLEPFGSEGLVIEYRSPRVFVHFYFAVPDYAITFHLGRIGIEDQDDQHGNYPFMSGDLARFCAADQKYVTSFCMGYQKEIIEEYVPQIAELLRIYGRPFLLADDQAYEEIARKRKQYLDNYNEEEKNQQLTYKAEEAWQRKDYSRTTELYQQLQRELTPLEEKRIAYAHKQVQ